MVKFIETESRKVITRHKAKGEMGNCCLMGMEFQFCKVKKALELAHTAMWIYFSPLNCRIKNG